MATIRVNVESLTSGKKNSASIPDDMLVSRILPVLVKKLGLPATDETGRRVSYRLLHRESGNQLRDNDTLVSANVKDDHTLKILAEVIAGSYFLNIT